ncbi:putative ABC transporter permease [Adlercreutzia equolifaciens]|uniref:putative ABC transporter permease n=1 Tax=Adlercreutzia equolifaciens TaxID=446660 RepID=UPI0026DB3583|nr:putative ABC transporter permease [Adlercreutzia equolifaciens]
MPIFLNRFHKSNWLVIFLVAAVIGGAFEAFVSLFMQYAFGAVAWDYSNMPGSLFGGRTCLPFMACWGLLGVVWIKLLLPFMLRLVNFIPWNWRYMLTTVAACFMLVDAVMTLQALDCWYMRLSHDPIDTPIQQFYDREFGDTYMADRFQSMTIVPSDAVRG